MNNRMNEGEGEGEGKGIGKVTPRKRNYEYAVRSSDAFISN